MLLEQTLIRVRFTAAQENKEANEIPDEQY